MAAKTSERLTSITAALCPRAQLRAELDAAYLHLYGISRDDVIYILTIFHGITTEDEAHDDPHTRS